MWSLPRLSIADLADLGFGPGIRSSNADARFTLDFSDTIYLFGGRGIDPRTGYVHGLSACEYNILSTHVFPLAAPLLTLTLLASLPGTG